MFTLDHPSKKLQVVLGGAVATNECPIVIGFEEANSRGASRRTTDAITTGGTAVDVLTSTAGVRRTVMTFSLYNADTTDVTATVRLYTPGGTTRIITKVTLATNETLLYDEERGWYCLDANGRQKASSSTADSATISTARSTGDSAGLRASTAGSTATSQHTAQSTTISIVKSSADSG